MVHLDPDERDDYESPPWRKREEFEPNDVREDVEDAGLHDGVWRYPASRTGPFWWTSTPDQLSAFR